MPRKSKAAAANPRASNPEVLNASRVEPTEPADPSPPGVSRDLSPAATAGQTEPEPSAAAESESARIRVTVEVYRGDITDLPADVAVVGRYKGVEARGPARHFDRRLDSWISYAIEFGMVGSELGELFYIPTRGPGGRASGAGVPRRVAPDAVFLAGLGEPGRFNREGLHVLMTNVTLAAISLRHEKVSAPLLGYSRNEMPLEAILRGTLEGIADGLSRLRESPNLGMVLRLIHPDQDTGCEILRCLRGIGAHGIGCLELEVHDRRNPPIGPSPDGKAASKRRGASRRALFSEVLQTPERMLRITITCPNQEVVEADSSTANGWRRFQYSALAESAVIPVREQQVQTYFASHLPPRLAEAPFAEQETYGKLLASYLVPEDFRKLIETGDPLTLVLDATTALYPWEMAGFKGYRGTSFFGIDLRLARQFRTLLSTPPGLAPEVNHKLRMLLIADPAPNLPCVGARAEALAVLDALRDVAELWRRDDRGPPLDLEVTVRLGPTSGPARDELAPKLTRIEKDYEFARGNVRPCDPIELLALLINERYDIVHYAGHGVFDPKGQRLGWVFDKENCILSAAEIFCVRQVPRLVFANACWSSALSPEQTQDNEGPRRLQVSLAEAFFARGIQNYVGAGWPVDDADAATFARHFYRRALGLPADANDKVRPRPASLGEALAEARRALFQAKRPTWGAYQHYGQPGALLLAPPDEDAVGDGGDCH